MTPVAFVGLYRQAEACRTVNPVSGSLKRETIMKFLVSILLLVSIGLVIAGQKRPTSPLRSLVETEQAFSKASEVSGTRPSFMQFIADDGILFRPKAVLGKQWMIDHPVPASDKRPLLAWQPVFAAVSAAGDLGYTTGPWEFKNDINDAKATAFGEFVTVWKKQSDGSWKFAVDLGIGHPQSAGPLKIWKVKDSPAGRSTSPRDPASGKTALVNREAEFTQAAAASGPATAFSSFAANDVRLFREGSFPFLGSNAITRALASTKAMQWQSSGDGISSSGDLGYFYGTTQITANDSKTTEANFLRIWQKRGGVWQIVLDVVSPLPQ